VLTTQLYFPKEDGNQRDPPFNTKLLVSLNRKGGVSRATFNFALDTSRSFG
jgi:hypothetical protein